MKRYALIVLALLTCLCLFAGGEKEGAKEGEPIKLMLGSPVAEENPFTVGCMKFAELAEEKTNGRVTVNVLHSGQLGAEKELLESVMQGSVDMLVTSNVFKKGHRLRVDIMSSNFPLWDRNLNTGNNPGTDTESKVAEQKIYHDGDHPSHIILPVIPA